MPWLRMLVAVSEAYTSLLMLSSRPANRESPSRIALQLLLGRGAWDQAGRRDRTRVDQRVHRPLVVQLDGHQRVEREPGAVHAEVVPSGLVAERARRPGRRRTAWKRSGSRSGRRRRRSRTTGPGRRRRRYRTGPEMPPPAPGCSPRPSAVVAAVALVGLGDQPRGPPGLGQIARGHPRRRRRLVEREVLVHGELAMGSPIATLLGSVRQGIEVAPGADSAGSPQRPGTRWTQFFADRPALRCCELPPCWYYWHIISVQGGTT